MINHVIIKEFIDFIFKYLILSNMRIFTDGFVTINSDFYFYLDLLTENLLSLHLKIKIEEVFLSFNFTF